MVDSLSRSVDREAFHNISAGVSHLCVFDFLATLLVGVSTGQNTYLKLFFYKSVFGSGAKASGKFTLGTPGYFFSGYYFILLK